MLARRQITIACFCLLSGLVSRSMAQPPAREQAEIIRKLEAVGAKVQTRDGKAFRISFRGTDADGNTVRPVQELKQLPALDLTGCRIADDDLPGLIPLSLVQIQLNGTDVTDAGMEHLAEMKSLTLVNVENTQVGNEGLAQLLTLPNLGDLCLTGSLVTDEGLRQLDSARKVWRLSIGGPNVTNESLKFVTGLKRLSGLNVKSPHVTDSGIQTLGSVTTLRQVILTDTQVSRQTVDELKARHPNLRIALRKTPGGISKIPGRTGSSIPPRPVKADRSTGRATPPAVPTLSEQEAIAKLKSMGAEVEVKDGAVVRVAFSGNNSHLDDGKLSFLSGLTSLERLSLSRTGVSDELLKQLGGLRRLKSLRLHQTNVTWIGITELEQRLPQLKVFATAPSQPSPPWMMWVALAAIPLFLLTGFSFVRVILAQFRHVVTLSAENQAGNELNPKDLVSKSGGRAVCSAALGFGSFFALIGGAFLILGTSEAMNASATESWPTVEGQVVVSRVIKRTTFDHDPHGHDSTAYEPVIIYQYEVDGKEHTGHRIAYYRLSNHSAKTIDQKIPVGPVTVSYRPGDPSESVLKPGLAAESFLPVGLGGAAFVVGLVVSIGALLRRKRYAADADEAGSGWKFSIE